MAAPTDPKRDAPTHRLRACLRPAPPAAGSGIRLALGLGSGDAGSAEAREENLGRLERVAALAAGHGAQLLAFPELYLSGYIVTPELAQQLAEPVDGPSLQRVAAAARRHGLAIACPYPERATVAGKERFYDAIALFGADGQLLRNYRCRFETGESRQLPLMVLARRDDGGRGAVHELVWLGRGEGEAMRHTCP